MGKFLWVIVCLSCITSTTLAGNIDSLKAALSKKQDDTTRINILLALAKALDGDYKYDSSIRYAQAALSLASETGHKEGMAMAYRRIGMNISKQGKYEEALKNLSIGLSLTSNDMLKGDIYHIMAAVYIDKGDYQAALTNATISLNIVEKKGDKQRMCLAMDNIGLAHFSMGRYVEALHFFFSVVKVSEEIHEYRQTAYSKMNIGSVYIDMGNYPEALKYNLAALKLFEKYGNKADRFAIYNNLAVIKSNLKNDSGALLDYFAALKIAEEIGNTSNASLLLFNIASSYIELAKNKEALTYLDKAEKLARETNTRETMLLCCQTRGEMHRRLGEYSQARLFFFQRYRWPGKWMIKKELKFAITESGNRIFSKITEKRAGCGSKKPWPSEKK